MVRSIQAGGMSMVLAVGLLLPAAHATPPNAERAAAASSASLAKKKSKGTLKVIVTGSGSYTVTGKGVRKTGQSSKSFVLTAGTYKVRAAGGSVTPGRVTVKAGKTAKARVVFPVKPTVPTSPPVAPPPTAPPVVTPPSPPADTTPPGPVTGLAVGTRTTSSVALSWTNPTDPDLAQIIVRRAQGATAPGSATAGTAVTLGSAKATSVTDTGLSADTRYSYAVFTRDTTGNTTPAGVTVTARTLAVADNTPPGPVTNLAVTARGDTFVHLSWTNPSDGDLAELIVRRSQGATPPAAPTEGQAVTLGSPTATSLEDTGLSKTTRYSYALFTRDITGNTTTSPVTLTTRTRDNNESVCGQPLTENTTWSPDYRDVYLIDCQFTIPNGVTLTIEPGTILKFQPSAGVYVGGTLRAEGSAQSPLVFTSWRDDSAGGDSNGDGTGSSPEAGDWRGITVQGGLLSLVHADVRYADEVRADSSATPASFTVRDSSFAHGTQLLAGTSTSGGVDATVVIENNTLTDVGVVPTNPYWVFARGAGIEVYAGGDTPPLVRNNRVSGVRGEDPGGGFAVLVSGELVPANLTGNTGSDNDRNYLAAAGTLANDFTFPTSGLQWENLGITIPAGVHATVPAGVHPGVGRGGFWVLGDLSIQPGAVLKFDGHSPNSGPIYVQSGGTLTAAGTAADPITFTSWTDDSISGDTNRDGDSTGPSSEWGLWRGISISGEASLDGVVLRYASVAVEGTRVHVRGRIVDSTVGVRAASSGWIDARHVDWGDASGPSPMGRGTAVEGDVAVWPWVGAQVTEPTVSGQTAPAAPCAAVEFIGLRGSDQDLSGAQSLQFPYGMGPEVAAVYDSWRARLEQLDPSMVGKTRPVPVFYTAASTDNIIPWPPVPNGLIPFEGGVNRYFDSYLDGYAELTEVLLRESSRCPDQKFVLAGYSQGAWVIHDVLADDFYAERIVGVGLIADPHRAASEPGTNFGTASSSARGIWTSLSGPSWFDEEAGYVSDPQIASAYHDRLGALCDENDAVCDFSLSGSFDVHTNYFADQSRRPRLNVLGQFLASRTHSLNGG